MRLRFAELITDRPIENPWLVERACQALGLIWDRKKHHGFGAWDFPFENPTSMARFKTERNCLIVMVSGISVVIEDAIDYGWRMDFE